MSNELRSAVLAMCAACLWTHIASAQVAPSSSTLPCPTTRADQLNGITCQIGDLIYTFSPGSLGAPLFSPDSSGSGFTFSQIANPPPNGSAVFGMLFTVKTANGAATITGMQVSINGANVSGNGDVIADFTADSLAVAAGCSVPIKLNGNPFFDCSPVQFSSPVSQITAPPNACQLCAVDALYELHDPASVTSIHYQFLQGCQVSAKPRQTFHQFPDSSGPPPIFQAGVPPTFGFCPPGSVCPTGPPYPDAGTTALCLTQKSGCALTATATVVRTFPALSSETPMSLDQQLIALPLQPGYNVGWISGTIPSQKDRCELNFCRIPEVINNAALRANVRDVVQMVDSGPQIQTWLDPSCGSGLSPVNCYLEMHICKHGDRVILKLNEFVNGLAQPSGPHFIYVTGESSAGPADWDVFDPGWNPNNTVTPNELSTLSGHLHGFLTAVNSNPIFRSFEIVEAETYRDSTALSRAAINATANSPVELLLTNPQGLRLGNLEPGTDLFEIPLGSYTRDFPLADDEGLGSANGDASGIKNVYVPAPQDGAYTLTVAGTALGTYTLELRAVATDGSAQDVSTVGITSAGFESTYQVNFSSAPGSSLSTTRVVTFQSTLGEISNSLQLDLINRVRIADRLSDKIEEAAEKAAKNETEEAREILREFKDEVSDRTPRDIKEIAAQILLEDADSLLGQLPKPKDGRDDLKGKRPD
jgi:hypothetical protein